MAWESHSEKEMIRGKVIFEISRKNDVHNNYETDYSTAGCNDVLKYRFTVESLLRGHPGEASGKANSQCKSK